MPIIKTGQHQDRFENGDYVLELFYSKDILTHITFFSNKDGRDSINIRMDAEDYNKFVEIIKFLDGD